MRKAFIFSIIISLILNASFLSFAETQSTDKVSDINGYWAEETIKKWIEDDLITGYPNGEFRPNNNITRAEMITLINRVYGYY